MTFHNIFRKILCHEEHFFGSKAKGRMSKLMFQENKARKIFRKTDISYPLIRTRTLRMPYPLMYTRKFFKKFGVLCFLETPILSFALLPYYRRFDCLQHILSCVGHTYTCNIEKFQTHYCYWQASVEIIFLISFPERLIQKVFVRSIIYKSRF